VGGYEEGFQSAQAGSSDAFIAVYGSALFFKNSFGPFYSIRLETAPQTTGTYSVVSVLTTPSGEVTPQNLQAVGTAVDLNVGFEQKIAKYFHGQTTLSAIAGGGFTNPLQANSINASFTMPLFGTVECTELQSRLMPVLTAKNTPYLSILPNMGPTSNPPSGNPCFFNNIAATTSGGVTTGGVAITTLTYAAPDQPNFFPKWQLGLRALSRFPSPGGVKECTVSYPCDRGYVDFTLGQDASISGGSLQHMVMKLDSIYPLPVPTLNYIYLFGTISRRFLNLPPNLSPLVLAAAPSTTTSGPSTSTLVLPMTQPDRDFYRIGVGVSLCQIFTALTTKGSVCPF
jgi:hypothetical protein